ncbi:hypothetical protein JW897_11810 [Chromobacterium alkanivorans]|uniref:hypothetical protein n=1 Tax=Chromobacterium alkanivorans TaxID=1071719 RepID=UPI0019689BBC|nr:hypothetical protein [Chromobacterium alkanivorans]MBN3004419.1 hypothetical protein [Chromobacterium alkanivorans]
MRLPFLPVSHQTLDVLIPRYLNAPQAKEASALAKVLTACSNQALERGCYANLSALRDAIAAEIKPLSTSFSHRNLRLNTELQVALKGVKQRIAGEQAHLRQQPSYTAYSDSVRRLLGEKASA